jgi:aminobenzoyl-glutamate utilization protein B
MPPVIHAFGPVESAMTGKQKKQRIREQVAAEKRAASRLAGAIWELAELPWEETGSSRLIAEYLAERGFQVTWPFRAVPTAFKAVRGKGKPVIGLLGEYDALPECGAKPGQPGHGCGHNLLGVGSAVAAVAAAELLAAEGTPGRVVYWGCPAEEALAGKVYMARDGGFRGLDACLCWHPSGDNRVKASGGSALDSIVFEYRGKTSHGAYAHGGRSALDAAVLTDVAANYLREHVAENVRMHCVLPDGGNAPNVVPEYARLWYYVRGKDRKQVDDVTRRLILCAKGAATATETTVKHTMVTSMYNRLPNRALAEAAVANFLLFGAPRATKKDRARVAELRGGADAAVKYATTVQEDVTGDPGRASSDEDTVSWLAPLTGVAVACIAKGTTGHHRDYTAQTNLPFAHRGMLRAAEVLAATTWDLCADKKLLSKAKAEFKKGTKDFTFDPLIPKKQNPLAVDPRTGE